MKSRERFVLDGVAWDLPEWVADRIRERDARIAELEEDAHKWQTYTMLRDVAHAAERIAELEKEVKALEDFKLTLIALAGEKRYQDAIADVLAEVERWDHVIADRVREYFKEKALRGEGEDEKRS